MRPQLSPNLLPTLFTSLTRQPKWTLHRTLKSDNPLDINGSLTGTATFTPLPIPTNPQSSSSSTSSSSSKDILYHEEGEMPTPPGLRTHPSAGVGLRFTKKYIWRFDEGRISIWFAKVGSDVPDYLFHEFEFVDQGQGQDQGQGEGETFVDAPAPPGAGGDTVVYRARGNHLCINDMYRTAYAFRVREGEVVSWASRHVVKGPRKDQDIVNIYWVGV
ncbi:hypothetical protein ETB97_000732 [Aspergillus alliaceus]|uniref:DUF6314 domain-containing protein n=1 Tax=Petromyces alliaceus TaxID=209559 RepID=A0A8H6ACY9_PETAA|nr:hypothetical protein ETB97_000732 [Aspergillus burnettii]